MYEQTVTARRQKHLDEKQADLDAYQALPLEDQDEHVLEEKIAQRNHAQVCRDHPGGCPPSYESHH